MIKKFIDVIKKGSATFLIFLQSTRTIETKSLSPVADSLSYFRVLSLEELRFEQEVVRSKPASKIIEIPRPTDIRTTEKKRRALQSPIIGAKTPPIAYAYSPKILLEEVQSKSDAGIIEIPKKTVIPIPIKRTIGFSEAGIFVIPQESVMRTGCTVRIKISVKTKNNNYNNET
jgi:hypothetical protein